MTNQIEIRDMDNDIVNLLIGNREKISSAILIEKSVKDAKKTLLLRFGEQLSLLLTKKYGKKAEIELNKSFGDKYAGIKVYSNNTKEVFFQISFLSENREFYLEIFNEDNIEEGVLKKIKNESNINYYKDKLNLRCRPLGQIQNVTSAWLGDWVCRYSKLDSYFSDGNGWGDLADKNYEMANTVLDEISPIIDAMIDRIGSK
jgi:hypothetical protein